MENIFARVNASLGHLALFGSAQIGGKERKRRYVSSD